MGRNGQISDVPWRQTLQYLAVDRTQGGERGKYQNWLSDSGFSKVGRLQNLLMGLMDVSHWRGQFGR